MGFFSVQELNARPYATAPFAAGLTAADYRAQHDEHGEGFRLWHASEVPGVNRSGKTYEEAVLGSIGKARFHSTQRDVTVRDFGVVPTGSTMISCLPEVARLHSGDKLLRTSAAQVRAQRAVVVRDSGSIDPLPHRFVSAIDVVKVNGVAVSPSKYRLVEASRPDDNQRGGIEWLAGAPAAGTRYFVRYLYRPFYVCLGESMSGQPVGEDGLLLPQRVLLREERE